MINEGHRLAKNSGYRYSIILVSEKYYQKFGYIPADIFYINAPFDVPRENFMAYKLDKNAPDICGTIQYSKEFEIS